MVEVNSQLLILLTGIGSAGTAVAVTWWWLVHRVRRSQRKALDTLNEAAMLKRSLFQAQADLREVLNESPFLVLLFDRHSHQVSFANKAARVYFSAANVQDDISRCELASGSGDFDSDFDELIGDYVQQHQTGSPSVTSSMRQLRFGGQRYWFSISISYINVLPGAPVCCILDDCSRQTETEQKLQIYRGVTDRVANHDSLEITLRDICRFGEALFQGARCGVCVLDQRHAIVAHQGSHDDGVLESLSAKESHGITQVALASERRVICEDIQSDARISRVLKNQLHSWGYQAWVAEPILDFNGRVLGVLELFWPELPAADHVMSENLDQLKALTQIAIASAQTVTRVRQDAADEAFTRDLADEFRETEPSQMLATLPRALERIGSYLNLRSSELDLWMLDADSNSYRSVSAIDDGAHRRLIPEHRLNGWLESALRERLQRSAPSELRESSYRFCREQSHFRHLLSNLSRHAALGIESIILFPLQSGSRLEGFVTVMEGSDANLRALRVIDSLIHLFRDVLSRNRLIEGDAVNVHKDSLTGLFNRQKMFELLSYEAVRAKRYKTRFTLVLVDVDDLGRINDRYGHDAGDQVIQSVGAVLAASVRSSDVVGRLAGDRYMVLLLETAVPGAVKVADTLRGRIEQLEVGAISGISASAGIVGNGEGESAQDLLARAEQHMLEAKRRGRGSVMVEGGDVSVAID
ncbi:sensor domain-containing diguanylate cyclase [Marinobacter sp. SS21]|uniref:sensor domain-containing diguanylate cyclase n=1 Tax=Marinobacter sp. SS21 TaxID=2979460 RepID=UPI00232FFEF4|nr:sensor domain-containing diguanylate cyclase [Marinobacter sp. SS21]MDC0662090.1 sensor domain-containing diguanylate cyclase [Marinobacter sp. SS21]